MEEIYQAAQRAAALTQQLLAFSRRQVMQPKVIDLNALVANVEKLLRRLIGEDILFATVLHPRVGNVRAEIVRHGMLEPGLAYLEKPFRPAGLLQKVRETLRRPR